MEQRLHTWNTGADVLQNTVGIPKKFGLRNCCYGLKAFPMANLSEDSGLGKDFTKD
jgi:hypothetical protein